MAEPVDYSRRDTDVGLFVLVWGVLVAINLIELLVTWRHIAENHLTAVLMGLAIIAAGLVLSFFMHLKYETRRPVWTLIPATVFVMVMMIEMSPDSTRAKTLRSPIKIDTPATEQAPQQ